jgi:hypothetical protein
MMHWLVSGRPLRTEGIEGGAQEAILVVRKQRLPLPIREAPDAAHGIGRRVTVRNSPLEYGPKQAQGARGGAATAPDYSAPMPAGANVGSGLPRGDRIL